MSPSDLGYAAPETVAEAVRLLAEYGGDARVLAGGQSLIPLLNLRMARPRLLVDISRIAALRGIRHEGEKLALGALTRHTEVAAASGPVRAAVPLLAAAAGLIGHVQIRTRGTIGGSLAHGDAAAEYALAAVVLGADLELVSPGGQRRLPAAEFFLAPLVTALQPAELLTRVLVPVPPAGSGWAFREHKPLTSSFPLVTAAALLSVDGGGRVAAVRAAVGAVDLPACWPAVAEVLVGRHPTPQAVAATARAGVAGLQCEDDHQASAGYRRRLAELYLRDVLSEAAARAAGAAP